MKFYNSYVLYVLALIVSVMSANVSEAASVELDEVATVSLGGEQLKLKGTATKNHSHQAVYVGGLYAPDDINTAEEILNDDGSKRFVLLCKNKKIDAGAFLRALNVGIVANHTEKQIDELEPKIRQFSNLWKLDIKQGDMVWIDFVPERGTVISINGLEKGNIAGKDFYDAFLKAWIGEKPINQSMKKQLLGEG